jgi:hypothetical protein
MQSAPTPDDPAPSKPVAEYSPGHWTSRRGVKPALLALGWLCVGLGMVGLVIPGLPTTIFLIVALWAFSKSSDRFHAWLYDHPRFGPSLQAWSDHGVVPVRAKIFAAVFMIGSWLIFTLFVAETWIGPTILGVVLLGVAIFVTTRPSVSPR